MNPAWYLHSQGLDTSTPMGKAMFQIAGVFAELERSVIKERINAGLDRARANGIKLGRPRISATTAKDLRKGKIGIHKVAAAHGVGVGTVQRIKGSILRAILRPPTDISV